MALPLAGACAGGFTVWVGSRGRFCLGTVKRLPGKSVVPIELGGVAVAGQRARALLKARVGDGGSSVVEEVLDVMARVLEAGRRRTWTVNQRMAPGDALRKPAIVVSWFQRLPSFVFGEQRIYKIRTHGFFA